MVARSPDLEDVSPPSSFNKEDSKACNMQNPSLREHLDQQQSKVQFQEKAQVRHVTPVREYTREEYFATFFTSPEIQRNRRLLWLQCNPEEQTPQQRGELVKADDVPAQNEEPEPTTPKTKKKKQEGKKKKKKTAASAKPTSPQILVETVGEDEDDGVFSVIPEEEEEEEEEEGIRKITKSNKKKKDKSRSKSPKKNSHKKKHASPKVPLKNEMSTTEETPACLPSTPDLFDDELAAPSAAPMAKAPASKSNQNSSHHRRQAALTSLKARPSPAPDQNHRPSLEGYRPKSTNALKQKPAGEGDKNQRPGLKNFRPKSTNALKQKPVGEVDKNQRPGLKDFRPKSTNALKQKPDPALDIKQRPGLQGYRPKSTNALKQKPAGEANRIQRPGPKSNRPKIANSPKQKPAPAPALENQNQRPGLKNYRPKSTNALKQKPAGGVGLENAERPSLIGHRARSASIIEGSSTKLKRRGMDPVEQINGSRPVATKNVPELKRRGQQLKSGLGDILSNAPSQSSQTGGTSGTNSNSSRPSDGSLPTGDRPKGTRHLLGALIGPRGGTRNAGVKFRGTQDFSSPVSENPTRPKSTTGRLIQAIAAIPSKLRRSKSARSPRNSRAPSKVCPPKRTKSDRKPGSEWASRPVSKSPVSKSPVRSPPQGNASDRKPREARAANPSQRAVSDHKSTSNRTSRAASPSQGSVSDRKSTSNRTSRAASPSQRSVSDRKSASNRTSRTASPSQRSVSDRKSTANRTSRAASPIQRPVSDRKARSPRAGSPIQRTASDRKSRSGRKAHTVGDPAVNSPTQPNVSDRKSRSARKSRIVGDPPVASPPQRTPSDRKPRLGKKSRTVGDPPLTSPPQRPRPSLDGQRAKSVGDLKDEASKKSPGQPRGRSPGALRRKIAPSTNGPVALRRQGRSPASSRTKAFPPMAGPASPPPPYELPKIIPPLEEKRGTETWSKEGAEKRANARLESLQTVFKYQREGNLGEKLAQSYRKATLSCKIAAYLAALEDAKAAAAIWREDKKALQALALRTKAQQQLDQDDIVQSVVPLEQETDKARKALREKIRKELGVPGSCASPREEKEEDKETHIMLVLDHANRDMFSIASSITGYSTCLSETDSLDMSEFLAELQNPETWMQA